ncbi:MAG: hypothetical protein QOC77_2853 [Thermoleophilaceae bacterium]|nr:hypothetical protein [Solirubrobacteraceae bacterium]MEA2412292.1 hypothetical protein [Thermoleophilaceae bacterium]
MLLGSRIVRPAALAAVLIACAGAAVSAAATKHRLPGTAAGRALARHALITRAALGPGFTSSPAPRSVPQLRCPGFRPALPKVVQIGAAVSPTFSGGASGPFISQSAFAYANAAQQRRVWHRVITRGLLRCARESLQAGSSRGVQLRATSAALISPPRVTRQTAGYRVTGTATAADQVLDVDLDMLVVGRGTVITTIVITSFSEAPDAGLEARLARAALRRLPRP